MHVHVIRLSWNIILATYSYTSGWPIHMAGEASWRLFLDVQLFFSFWKSLLWAVVIITRHQIKRREHHFWHRTAVSTVWVCSSFTFILPWRCFVLPDCRSHGVWSNVHMCVHMSKKKNTTKIHLYIYILYIILSYLAHKPLLMLLIFGSIVSLTTRNAFRGWIHPVGFLSRDIHNSLMFGLLACFIIGILLAWHHNTPDRITSHHITLYGIVMTSLCVPLW